MNPVFLWKSSDITFEEAISKASDRRSSKRLMPPLSRLTEPASMHETLNKFAKCILKRALSIGEAAWSSNSKTAHGVVKRASHELQAREIRS